MPITETTPRYSQEITELLDSIDRWKIAERYGVDNVHGKTRAQLFRAFEQSGHLKGFQDVARLMTSMNGDGGNRFTLPIINFAEFMSDDPEGKIERASALSQFEATTRWLKDAVTHLCPFVTPSLEENRIWMTSADRLQSTGDAAYHFLIDARNALVEMGLPDQGRQNVLNAITVLFPDYPNDRSATEDLGAVLRDIGLPNVANIQMVAFAPSDKNSRIVDKTRTTPPVVVFRHGV